MGTITYKPIVIGKDNQHSLMVDFVDILTSWYYIKEAQQQNSFFICYIFISNFAKICRYLTQDNWGVFKENHENNMNYENNKMKGTSRPNKVFLSFAS